jgi:hypothetical protein
VYCARYKFYVKPTGGHNQNELGLLQSNSKLPRAFAKYRKAPEKQAHEPNQKMHGTQSGPSLSELQSKSVEELSAIVLQFWEEGSRITAELNAVKSSYESHGDYV